MWMGFTSPFRLKPFFFDGTVNSNNYLAKQEEVLVEQHVGGYRKERKGKTNAANGMMLICILSFQRIRRSLLKRAAYPLKA